MAVGVDGSGEDVDAAVWTSPDGFTWSRVVDQEGLSEHGFQMMMSVTAGGPGLVAVGVDETSVVETSAAVWVSPDGITWTRVSEGELFEVGSQEMRSVTAGGSGLVAVGVAEAGTAIWESTDGVAWTRVPLAAAVGHRELDAVTTGESALVAVGSITLLGRDADAAVWWKSR